MAEKRASRQPRQRAPKESSRSPKRALGWLFAAFLICWAFVLGVLVGQGSLATPEQVAWVKQALGLERLLGSDSTPPPQRLTEAQLSFYDRVKEQRKTSPVAPDAPAKPAAKPPEPAPAPQAQAPAPAPTAKPAPAPTAPAQPQGPVQAQPQDKRRFTVQVASFSDKDQALNLVRRLQDSGYPAYTLMVDVQGAGRRYRVRVGPYAQLDAAQGAAGRIRLQHKLAAYVTRRD
ncbi:MAG: SPOR domain-containing protein [Desulfarculus sp.]|nr:SPOR domain-containing protein [Pseudomonadota bacterium]MBV1715383.1 SPOR domain-containing protein [Desulfarculus sp.]MBU4573978.1 SPOR domain-containing protein [Pseudomonadota bacterium]MBU4596270.1 SPOR domain-containing protein [Pseudomonadota bacterium]MBV1737578.1 SPOR domain-containing protein [Desulfarculus sp.]